MSGRLVGEILDNAPADLPSSQRFVLVALAEAAHDRDRTARYYSSVADLSRRTGLATGTVRNNLSALAKRGLIRPIHAPGIVQRGSVQHYEIARLTSRHRFATWTDDDPDEDEESDRSCHSTVTRLPVHRVTPQ